MFIHVKNALIALNASIEFIEPYVKNYALPDEDMLNYLEEHDPFHIEMQYNQGIGCIRCPLASGDCTNCCNEKIKLIAYIGNVLLPVINKSDFNDCVVFDKGDWEQYQNLLTAYKNKLLSVKSDLERRLC